MISDKEKFPNKIKLYNAIKIDSNNVAIERDINKCIDCGLCLTTCKNKIAKRDVCDTKSCIYCGQCVNSCPVNALKPKNDMSKLQVALKTGKICIAYIAPAVRVSMGEIFGMGEGCFVQGQIVAALRKLGIKYVFDVTTGADLTVIEEATELINRMKYAKNLPMFTSCCPAWVKYAKDFHQEFLPNLSTCKSPIGMQSAIVKSYFCEKQELDPNKVFTIAITPCTAKKYEICNEENYGTDVVVTAREFGELLKLENIDLKDIEPEDFDDVLGEGTGAGMIFGVSGGVSESIIRTVYKIISKEDLTGENLVIKQFRSNDAIKDISINIKGIKINIAIINGINNVEDFFNTSCNWQDKYHLIEVMGCEGGCVAGGGQPRDKSVSTIRKRANALGKKDTISKFRLSYKNPQLINLYDNYLIKPNSDIAEKLLHTNHNK